MTPNDADLQQLMEIWPSIPPHFRKQILELARGWRIGLTGMHGASLGIRPVEASSGRARRHARLGKGGPINHTTSDISQTEWLASFPTVDHQFASQCACLQNRLSASIDGARTDEMAGEATAEPVFDHRNPFVARQQASPSQI